MTLRLGPTWEWVESIWMAAREAVPVATPVICFRSWKPGNPKHAVNATWVDDHYVKLDKVVAEYNDVYFKPAKEMLTL